MKRGSLSRCKLEARQDRPRTLHEEGNCLILRQLLLLGNLREVRQNEWRDWKKIFGLQV
jgi:hypothetical protein